MLKVRVIPVLLLRHWGLEKSVKFANPKYVGCPINAARVFNRHCVDELMLLDIVATEEKRAPQIDVVSQIAKETGMPFTVGGGIRNIRTIRELLCSGADKVVINTGAVEIPGLVEEASRTFGRQCIVVSIDAREVDRNKYEVFTHGGKCATGLTPVELAKRVEDEGAGEILITSIDRDGMMEGYDLRLINLISEAVSIPVIACGGAGSVKDLADAFYNAGASAVAGGAFFLFYGPRRTVLITYPSEGELREYFNSEHVRVRDQRTNIKTELARL
ncbi:MAG: AglZ/HisF2 family acetamidino modification protein [Candidatus Hydrogenedentes bacterium]|nr:AglZ/HisF2 family acetamidino modification protein [Candidatus Hydrogenedentota bacterium]